MAQHLRLNLSGEQRLELENARAQHQRPYVRERAAALVENC